MESNEEVVDHLECVGVDGKMHWCIPWSDKTNCGIAIQRKTLTQVDFNLRFWCISCTGG